MYGGLLQHNTLRLNYHKRSLVLENRPGKHHMVFTVNAKFMSFESEYEATSY